MARLGDLVEYRDTPVASGSNRVVVDWDGTCVQIAWPKMGAWITGAPEFLQGQLDEGRDVMIFTTRTAPTEVDEVTPREPGAMQHEIDSIRQMLDAKGLHAVGIWTNPWKPGGVAYIDDKAIAVSPVEWFGKWETVADRIDAMVGLVKP